MQTTRRPLLPFARSPFCAAAIALLASLGTACGTPAGAKSSSATGAIAAADELAVAQGWLSWRGPAQNGTSTETGLIEAWEPGGEGDLWSYAIAGRGTPVIGGGRVYALGYEGKGKDLLEKLLCFDEESGELLWEIAHADFLSDVVYDRYAIGSPVIDAETGHVLYLTTPGLLRCVTPDGALVWEHSMVGEFGRLTYPNGRTTPPVIDGDLVIFHTMTSGWGPLAPARDRFFGFDKNDGRHVWTSTPGEGPKDSPYAYPVFEWRGGRRVLYAGTACGNVVCIDARNGDPLWRFQLATGGVCASMVLDGDHLIAVHGKENLDSSKIGRMVSLSLGAEPEAGAEGPIELSAEAERWRADLVAFTSSPVLVGDRIYQTTASGELNCVNKDTGEVLWSEKLAPDQIHASPVWADGKLYVPMNNGSFFILRPTDEGPGVLSQAQLEGNCLGAPAIANGRVYVHTTKRLYCFGKPAPDTAPAARLRGAAPEQPGEPARLQVVPADLMLVPGERVTFETRVLDAKGNLLGSTAAELSAPAGLSASVSGATLTVAADAHPGAGLVTAEADGLRGAARMRIVPLPPFRMDFEDYELTEAGGTFGWPNASWLAGKPKWDVREVDGSKVLAKNITNPLFQRTVTYFGHPSTSNTTMQVDIMTDGNRRTMSSAGVIHQRYQIELRGNYQDIEVTSNDERIKEFVPFKWKAGTWYTLKTRVDVADDGSGVVRAKVWPRDEAEPEGWHIEVEHANAHTEGAPGFCGFVPQSRFRVHLDNLIVTPNE